MALSLRRLVKLAVACLSLLTITGLYLQWTTRHRYHTTTTSTARQTSKQFDSNLYLDSHHDQQYELPWHPLTNENDNRPKDNFNISLSRTLNTRVPETIITKHSRREKKKTGNFKTKDVQYSVGLPPPNSQENVEASNQNNGGCVDVLCTQYLSERDWRSFNVCRVRTSRKISAQKAREELDKHGSSYNFSINSDPLTSGDCRFMNGSGRGVTGLVSFPGSGNTWVRELLQTVTGICTGSVYCDGALRSSGFDGERVQSASVLVVKQHTPAPKWTTVKNVPQFDVKNRPHYDMVIFIVRNPFHALVSEWNRELSSKHGLHGNTSSSHTDSFGPEYFGSYKNWNFFVNDRIQKWVKEFNWIIGCPDDRDVILVRYEDLKLNVTSEIGRMLDFLSFHLSRDEIAQRLQSGKFSFHRKSTRTFNPFTTEQEQLISNAVRTVTNRLKGTFNRTYKLEEYANR